MSIIRLIICWFGLHKTDPSKWKEVHYDDNYEEAYDNVVHEENTCKICGRLIDRFNIIRNNE